MFLAQMDLYFSLNKEKINTKRDKVLTMAMFMEEPVLDWMQPKLHAIYHKTPEERDSSIMKLFEDSERFVKLLELIFEDLDQKAMVKQKIHQLQQTKSTSKYTAEFMQLASLAEYDNEALADKFYQDLKDEVKDEVVKILTRSGSLKKMIEVAVQINNHI